MKQEYIKMNNDKIESIFIYFFGAAFLAGFFAAGFLAAGFLAAFGFLAAGFFAAFFGFLAAGFLAFGSLAASLKDPAPFFPAAAAATSALESTIFFRASLTLAGALAASTL